jgi:O-antigen/teichoic acid export membrane protein
MRDKIKSLSKDTLVYGTSTMVSRFLTFLLVPLYTNVFLPAEYGVITVIFSYIAILNVFFSIGLESGYFKFASTLEVGSAKENFSNPFLIIIANSFLLSLILFIFSGSFSSLFLQSSGYSPIIKYAAGILFFDAAVLVPFAYLRLNNKAKVFAGIKMINIAVNVALNLLLILVFKMGIEAVFISNLAASALTLLILMPYILKNFTASINKPLIRELFLFSLPVIPAGIGANLIQVIDRPILTYLTDESTVGIYQANYKLGIFMMLFVAMFEFAWRPFLLNNAKEKNAREIYSKVMTLFVIAGSFTVLVVSLFIDEIVMLNLPFKGNLIGRQYWSGLHIVPVVLLAYLFYGIYINLTAGIYIEKKTKYLPVVTGTAAGLNIIANFILIPLMDITGAAIATLLSYVCMAVMLYVFVRRFYKINYEYAKVALVLILLIASYCVFLFSGSIGLPSFTGEAAALILFIVLIFAFRIVDISTAKRFLRR